MEPTLKVKNESATPVTLGEGGEAVTIAANGEEELEAKLLSSSAFAQALAEGRLRFVLTPNPSEDKLRLARRVFPGMVRGLGPGFLALGGRLDASFKALERRRLEYNHSWKQTEFLLKAAEASADGAENLLRGARHFAFNVKLEEAAEKAIQAELDALRATDSGTITDLPAFLEQVKAKEAELAEAVARREAAEARFVKPFESVTARLDAVAQTFQGADPGVDIGQEVPPFP
jgi:hypothetical protein